LIDYNIIIIIRRIMYYYYYYYRYIVDRLTRGDLFSSTAATVCARLAPRLRL